MGNLGEEEEVITVVPESDPIQIPEPETAPAIEPAVEPSEPSQPVGV